jgi:hypothetical protein
MATGILSKGIELSYKKDQAFVALTNLLEIPDLGGEVEAVEITTLADSAHVYIDGLKNYGDSLEFKFNYEGDQFAALNALEGTIEWQVQLPEGETCTFSGSCSVRLDGVGINAALTYTLAVKPSSEMIWA